MEEPPEKAPRRGGRPKGRKTTQIRPPAQGRSGFRDRRHQALWRRLVPLGFLPYQLMKCGPGNHQEWGGSWWRISAYHPGFGIGVQIVFTGGKPSRKLEFLEAHCARFFTVPEGPDFYEKLDVLVKELREIVGSRRK